MRRADISANTPFDRAAGATLGRLLEQMSKNLPGTLRGDDIEALHDMRVASRRLRAALRVFRPCFAKQRYEAAAQSVREVTRTLGQVRDQDVLLDFLNGYESTRDGIGWIVQRETHIRDGARMRMLDNLQRMHREDELGRLGSVLALDPTSDPGCGTPFDRHAAKPIIRQWGRLERLSEALDDPSRSDKLHCMRIAAKRLRYTMEVFVPCFGPALEKKIADVKSMQEYLGRLHDRDVWTEKLRAYLNEPGLTQVRTEALGLLIAHLTDERQDAFESAGTLWKRMRSEKFARELDRLVDSGRATKKAGRKVGSKLSDKTKDNKPAAKNADSSEWGILKGSKTETQDVPEAEPPAPPDISGAVAAAREFSGLVAGKIESMGNHPKLAKQIEKLGAVLDQIEASAEPMQEDAAKKVSKWLHALEAESSTLSPDAKLSDKQLDKLRDKIRSVRRKVADKAKAVVKP